MPPDPEERLRCGGSGPMSEAKMVAAMVGAVFAALGILSTFGGLLVGVWISTDLMDKLVPTGIVLALLGGVLYIGMLEAS
jgi:hypothetical protein